MPSYRCVGASGRPSVDHVRSLSARELDRMASGRDGHIVLLLPSAKVDVAEGLAALYRELEALAVHLQGRIPFGQ